MSLKDNIKAVKDELNSEEKFFEKAVLTERFVKRYKKPLISIVVLIVAILIGMMIKEYLDKSKIESVNSAFTKLQTNADDTEALKILEQNSPALADAFKLHRAVDSGDIEALKKLKSSTDSVVADLASYTVAASTQDAKQLSSYANKSDAIYRDFAILDEAVILLKNNEISKAHMRLRLISEESILYESATALMHYGVK